MAKRPMAHRAAATRHVIRYPGRAPLVTALLFLVVAVLAASAGGVYLLAGGQPRATSIAVADRSPLNSGPSDPASGSGATSDSASGGPAAPSDSSASDSAEPSASSASPDATSADLATARPTRPLPGLIGAIGDSYTQAFSTSWSEMYDHPGHSWSIGTTRGDGVYSLAERLQALGDNLLVSDAATSGRRMDDGPRQAGVVLNAAKQLAAGRTALVTVALGTNDLCIDNMTSSATYEAYFRQTMSLLRNGLPAGSTVFVQTLVDFYKLGQLGQSSPAAMKTYRNLGVCPKFLGAVKPGDLEAGRARMAAYNEILTRVCAEFDTAGSTQSGLHCQTDAPGGSSYFNRNFTLADFSTVDYFHPSIAGQALMADSAWVASPWASLL